MSFDHLGFHSSLEPVVDWISNKNEMKKTDKELSTKMSHLVESFKQLNSEGQKSQAPILKAVILKLEENSKLLPADTDKAMKSMKSALGSFKPSNESQQYTSMVATEVIKNSSYVGQLSEEDATKILQNEPSGAWLLRYDATKGIMVLSSKEPNSKILHKMVKTADSVRLLPASTIDISSLRTIVSHLHKDLAALLIDKRGQPHFPQMTAYAARLGKDLRAPLCAALKQYPYNLKLLDALKLHQEAFSKQSIPKEMENAVSEHLKNREKLKEFETLDNENFRNHYVGQLSSKDAEGHLALPSAPKWLARISEKQGPVMSIVKDSKVEHIRNAPSPFDILSFLPKPPVTNMVLFLTITKGSPSVVYLELKDALLQGDMKKLKEIRLYAQRENVNISEPLQRALEEFLIQEIGNPSKVQKFISYFAEYPKAVSFPKLIVKLYEFLPSNINAIEKLKNFLMEKGIDIPEQLKEEFRQKPSLATLRALSKTQPTLYHMMNEMYRKNDLNQVRQILDWASELGLKDQIRLLEGALFHSEEPPSHQLVEDLIYRYLEKNNDGAALSLYEKLAKLPNVPQTRQKRSETAIKQLMEGIKLQQAEIEKTLQSLGIPKMPPRQHDNLPLNSLERLALFVHTKTPLGEVMNAIAEGQPFDKILDQNPQLKANRPQVMKLIEELMPIVRRATEKVNA